MKKIIVSLFLIIILGTLIGQVFAADKTFEMQLRVKNNSKNEDVEIYILLPQEYIEFAIGKSHKLIKKYVNYEGPDTLKRYDIDGINVKKSKVQDEIYMEDGVEYVQIKLEENLNKNYVFNILNDYGKMNIKYRVKNEYKDYIMHIDNFKIEKGVCIVEYDYDKDVIKQPDINSISTVIIALIVILILIILVGFISYIKSGK